MKSKSLLSAIVLFVSVYNCSKSIEYSETFKKETTGIYLYSLDDIIKVSYENNTLQLKWRGGLITPVTLDTNAFFVADMYTKLHFVKHPKTNQSYLSRISEDNPEVITFDYRKASADYKTPSALLDEGNYEKALAGYLEIKKQDSTSIFINERDFNSKGYALMSKHDYDKAIKVFKLNVALHPKSANVYDSLAQAYLVSGDSLQAFNNYKKTLEFNNGNKHAQSYVNAYKAKLE